MRTELNVNWSSALAKHIFIHISRRADSEFVFFSTKELCDFAVQVEHIRGIAMSYSGGDTTPKPITGVVWYKRGLEMVGVNGTLVITPVVPDTVEEKRYSVSIEVNKDYPLPSGCAPNSLYLGPTHQEVLLSFLNHVRVPPPKSYKFSLKRKFPCSNA